VLREVRALSKEENPDHSRAQIVAVIGSIRPQIEAVIRSIRPLAPGWNSVRLRDRILAIVRFCKFNDDAVIPLKRRREIRRLASELLKKLSGRGDQDVFGHVAEYAATKRAVFPPCTLFANAPPKFVFVSASARSAFQFLSG